MSGPLDLTLLAAGASALAAGLAGRRRAAHPDRDAVPSPAHVSAPTPAPGGPALAAPRVAEQDLQALAYGLRPSHGRARARDAVSRALAALDSALWHVERDVAVSGFVVPFIVFGPTGVFVLGAGEAWDMTDLAAFFDAARQVNASLPSYPDAFHVGLCIAPDGGEPRSWFNAQAHGEDGWVLGAAWLEPWLYSFTDRGFTAGDVAALRGHCAAAAARRRQRPLALPACGPQG